MNHSSTSSFNPQNSLPRLTKAGGVGIIVFLFVTILIHAMPDAAFVERDSVVMRNIKLTEATYLTGEDLSPKILVMGSSRLIGTNEEMVASQTGLPSDQVRNLSASGATFFYIESFLRRHPEIVEELELIVIDILPFQIMHTNLFRESDPYFLRYATLDQRMKARKISDRIVAVSDFAVPAWSRSQPPAAWKSGIRRSRMDAVALKEDILSRKIQDFPHWKNLIRLSREARKDMDGARKLNSMIFFGSSDVARNQVEALTQIVQLIPQDCRVALMWLPLSEPTQAIIENSPRMQEGRDAFSKFIDELSNPKVQVLWYSMPDEMDMVESDYTDDGIHFKPKGGKKVAHAIGEFYRRSN